MSDSIMKFILGGIFTCSEVVHLCMFGFQQLDSMAHSFFFLLITFNAKTLLVHTKELEGRSWGLFPLFVWKVVLKSVFEGVALF